MVVFRRARPRLWRDNRNGGFPAGRGMASGLTEHWKVVFGPLLVLVVRVARAG